MKCNNVIICLGAGAGQVPLIKAAMEQGLEVLAIDKNQTAPGFALTPQQLIMSTYDTAAVLSALDMVKEKFNFVGLLARVSGPAQKTAAAIAAKFNLRGINEQIAELATEKSKLREFCLAAGLPVPTGRKVASPDKTRQLKLPVVIKPDLPIVGEKAIRIIESAFALSGAIKEASEASGNKMVEVEKYVDGIDVACMFAVSNGKAQIIALWDELVGINNDGSIKGLAVSVPSVIEFSAAKQKIEEIVDKFSSFFPDTRAILILSFRVNPDGGAYIIELHADLGGDLIADILLPQASEKFNLFDLAANFAIGNDIGPKFDFQPTMLLYGKGESSADKNCGNIDGHALIQTGSLKENLTLAETVFVGFKQSPQHIRYLEKYER